MDKFNGVKTTCTLFLICAATAIALRAQTFTTLHSFGGVGGALPQAGLVQATDGNLYGTATRGGAAHVGTVFKITASGMLTTLYSFCPQSGCADGAYPTGKLVQATDGNFYGTAYQGGANDACTLGCGTVFKVTPLGTLTTLYSFCAQSGCTDGASPLAGMVQATDGNFYGTTSFGGANSSGTVFEITPSGTLTTLYSFCGQSGCTDGANPLASLVQATDGNFYGTTSASGVKFGGTVFKITASGMLTTLYSFCAQSGCTDGITPVAGLVQAPDGNFYGTTESGGASDRGTVFKITPGGTLTTLYSFCSQSACTDGNGPLAALGQATDGNFYGTTQLGGAGGTVFQITPSGTLTTLYSFCSQSSCTDGAQPVVGVVQDTNGTFYGTTLFGGTGTCTGVGCGTVFSLDVGLGPFVQPLPRLGKVGAPVRILGTNLTGTTSVTFNGTPAVFKVVLDSGIAALVPAGATTGTVQVVTPSGTLSSNVPFIVRP